MTKIQLGEPGRGVVHARILISYITVTGHEFRCRCGPQTEHCALQFPPLAANYRKTLRQGIQRHSAHYDLSRTVARRQTARRPTAPQHDPIHAACLPACLYTTSFPALPLAFLTVQDTPHIFPFCRIALPGRHSLALPTVPRLPAAARTGAKFIARSISP
ncbi:hypothetical protein E2C01_028620 [Portunus trituberculatus]|uniref:Uncharacterized protein n=1 Tax=Portunus trituberculatus TaxID=210409 RepID=A0A5B7EQH0_PORTR|nr:hypothetical protein [Portunus trituberculatus]